MSLSEFEAPTKTPGRSIHAVGNTLFSELKAMVVALGEANILDQADPLLTQSFVEGETQIPELIASVLRSIDEDLMLVEGIKVLVAEYEKRRSRLEGRIESMRGLIELALIRADITAIETPVATVSLRRLPPKLAEVDESRVPTEFFTTPAPRLDRSKLLMALKDGVSVPGAVLSNGGVSLTVRRH